MLKRAILVFTFLMCGYSVFAVTTPAQSQPLQEFLCDAKQYFAASDSYEKIKAFESADLALDLLQKIVNEFNAGILVAVQYKFYGFCKAFTDKHFEELELGDLRVLKDRLDRFNTFVDRFVNENKLSLKASELSFVENIKHFCSILNNDLLKEESFEFGFIDKAFDLLISRPESWVKKHPGITLGAVALPVGVLLITQTGILSSSTVNGVNPIGFNRGESEIGPDGLYMQTPVHVEGIPDGVYSEVDVASQTGCDCGAAATARALQKITRTLDTHTVDFRQQKYFELDLFYRPLLVSNIEELDANNREREEDIRLQQGSREDLDMMSRWLEGSKREIQTIRYRLAQPAGTPVLFNWMTNGLLRKLIDKINEGKEHPNKIAYIDYANLIVNAQCFFDYHYPEDRETMSGFIKFMSSDLNEFKNDENYPVGTSMLVICGPIMVKPSPDRGAHYTCYELLKTAPANSPLGSWFTIRCDDTLKLYARRRYGAYMLYNLLSTEGLAWSNNLPNLRTR